MSDSEWAYGQGFDDAYRGVARCSWIDDSWTLGAFYKLGWDAGIAHRLAVALEW